MLTVAESEDNPDWLAAEDVASSLDLVHHQKVMTNDSFVKDIPNLSWHGEDLDVSVLFFQPLFQEMRNHVKVGPVVKERTRYMQDTPVTNPYPNTET